MPGEANHKLCYCIIPYGAMQCIVLYHMGACSVLRHAWGGQSQALPDDAGRPAQPALKALKAQPAIKALKAQPTIKAQHSLQSRQSRHSRHSTACNQGTATEHRPWRSLNAQRQSTDHGGHSDPPTHTQLVTSEVAWAVASGCDSSSWEHRHEEVAM